LPFGLGAGRLVLARKGKKHSESTKAIMSAKKNKYSLGVGIYDLEDNLISKFKNNVPTGSEEPWVAARRIS